MNLEKTEKELEKVANLEKAIPEDEDDEEEEVAVPVEEVEGVAGAISADPESASIPKHPQKPLK